MEAALEAELDPYKPAMRGNAESLVSLDSEESAARH